MDEEKPKKKFQRVRRAYRGGRPSKTYLASLQKKIKKSDWKKLAEVCTQMLLSDQVDLELRLCYIADFPPDFPKGVLIAVDGRVDIYRANARRVLRWLEKNGHTEILIDDINMAKRFFAIKAASFDAECLDFMQENLYNDDIEI